MSCGQETNYTCEICVKDEEQKRQIPQGCFTDEGEPAMFGLREEHSSIWEHHRQRSIICLCEERKGKEEEGERLDSPGQEEDS